MSLTSSVFTLSNVTPTKIVDTWHTPQRVTLHNMSKSSNNFIHYGPSTVTTTNSIHLDPATTVELLLVPGDTLHAVSDPDGINVGVFVSRN
jgi:hypothetical protein